MTEGDPGMFAQLREWAARAQAAGWLEAAALAALARIERGRPADLFEAAAQRPLVVGLFGGTGVGKSSLLNRLAGAEVARTGVERPTSHEVTVYAHADMRLAGLPPELPVDRVTVRRHDNARQRDVLWIDMPDFDSTAQDNRALALAWLPHIDLVVYVVSPERYRDDAGWRLLRARGERHGWVFVMNRWDEAQDEQLDDLRAILDDAGFDDPLVLRTCAGGPHAHDTADDFERLVAVIDGLPAARGVEAIEQAADAARRAELARWLRGAAARLGDAAAWDGLAAQVDADWRDARAALVEGLAFAIDELAGRIALRVDGAQRARTWPRIVLLRPPPAPPAPLDAAEIRQLSRDVWDDWAQGRLDVLAERAELAAHRRGVAAAPVRDALDAAVAGAAQTVTAAMAGRLQAALARPGNALQRALRPPLALLAGAAPLAALGWAGYHVVAAFSQGVQGARPFLGIDFAVHALLLIAFAWALPFTAYRLLAPRPRRTAGRALRAGLEAGLDACRARLAEALEQLDSGRRALGAEAQHLLAALAPAAAEPADRRLRRLLSRRAE